MNLYSYIVEFMVECILAIINESNILWILVYMKIAKNDSRIISNWDLDSFLEPNTKLD